MRILHYMLGFPPYRTGGMTKYAMDLMSAQVDDGNSVIALWPGEIRSYSGKPQLKEKKSVNGIRSIEIINPLPIPLDEGIKEISAYTKSCDINIYELFLSSEQPEVIHIHTLMGIHSEFIMAANKLGIRTVFTTHDYFGICPKVTLYRYGECCDYDNECVNCIQCNLSSLSLKKIQIMQSRYYRLLKNNIVVKKIRKKHRSNFYDNECVPEMPSVQINEMAKEYRYLRQYYVKMYESIDIIHFNSTLAEEIYTRYVKPKDSAVVSITHKGIKEHKNIPKIKSKKKIIVSLAPAKPFKGWNVLKEACSQLWNEGRNIELRVYSMVSNPEAYMVVKEDGFKQSELEKILREADVLVAPSIWYETFGFTVLEALSYNVPVIVTNHVGAKDIIENSGMVVEAGNVEQLKNAIDNINVNEKVKVKEWGEFLKEMYEIYRG